MTLWMIPVLIFGGHHLRAYWLRRPATLGEFIAQQSDDVVVYYISDGEGVDLTTLSPKVNPRMYSLFRKAGPIRHGPAKGYYDVGFILTLKRDWTQGVDLKYSTVTGEVRLGDEYASVPPEFRIWMRDLYVRTPKQHFRRVREGGEFVNVPIVPPLPGPTVKVSEVGTRVHYYNVMPRPGAAFDIDHMPGATFQVQYAVGSVVHKPFAVATSLSFSGDNQNERHQFPPSYVGKTIYYRFRWKYKDGTYTQWSKTVSAKVLP